APRPPPGRATRLAGHRHQPLRHPTRGTAALPRRSSPGRAPAQGAERPQAVGGDGVVDRPAEEDVVECGVSEGPGTLTPGDRTTAAKGQGGKPVYQIGAPAGGSFFGGCQPTLTQSCRALTRVGRFRFNVTTVARPVGVRPMIRSPCSVQRKCSCQSCRPGFNNRTTSP